MKMKYNLTISESDCTSPLEIMCGMKGEELVPQASVQCSILIKYDIFCTFPGLYLYSGALLEYLHMIYSSKNSYLSNSY